MGVEEFAVFTITYAAGRSFVEKKHLFELLEGDKQYVEGIPSGTVEEMEESVLVRVFKENKHKTRMVNFVGFVNDPILFSECKRFLLNFLICCDRDRSPQKAFNLYLGYGSYYYMPFKSVEPLVQTLNNLKDIMYAYLSIDNIPMQGTDVSYLGDNIHGLQLDLNETDSIPPEWMKGSIRTLLVRSAYPRIHFNQLIEHVKDGSLDELRIIQVIKGPKMETKDVETLARNIKKRLQPIETERQKKHEITIMMDPIGKKEAS